MKVFSGLGGALGKAGRGIGSGLQGMGELQQKQRKFAHDNITRKLQSGDMSPDDVPDWYQFRPGSFGEFLPGQERQQNPGGEIMNKIIGAIGGIF